MLLEVENLSISFRRYENKAQQILLPVVRNLSFSLDYGQIMSVVGASGSGKTILLQAILGILPQEAIVQGNIIFQGQTLTPKQQRQLCGKKIAYIPQSVQFLDPLMRIEHQVCQGKRDTTNKKRQEQIFSFLGLPPATGRLFPHQISGGMTRKVLIACALMSNADLYLVDEPTPGLEESIVQDFLQTCRAIADQGKSILLISHDIGSILPFSDKVAFFYAGSILEIANQADFTANGQNLRHPFSKALYQALPQNNFTPIPGHAPYSGKLPNGCPFAPRCPKFDDCCQQEPPFLDWRNGKVACFHAT